MSKLKEIYERAKVKPKLDVNRNVYQGYQGFNTFVGPNQPKPLDAKTAIAGGLAEGSERLFNRSMDIEAQASSLAGRRQVSIDQFKILEEYRIAQEEAQKNNQAFSIDDFLSATSEKYTTGLKDQNAYYGHSYQSGFDEIAATIRGSHFKNTEIARKERTFSDAHWYVYDNVVTSGGDYNDKFINNLRSDLKGLGLSNQEITEALVTVAEDRIKDGDAALYHFFRKDWKNLDPAPKQPTVKGPGWSKKHGDRLDRAFAYAKAKAIGDVEAANQKSQKEDAARYKVEAIELRTQVDQAILNNDLETLSELRTSITNRLQTDPFFSKEAEGLVKHINTKFSEKYLDTEAQLEAISIWEQVKINSNPGAEARIRETADQLRSSSKDGVAFGLSNIGHIISNAAYTSREDDREFVAEMLMNIHHREYEKRDLHNEITEAYTSNKITNSTQRFLFSQIKQRKSQPRVSAHIADAQEKEFARLTRNVDTSSRWSKEPSNRFLKSLKYSWFQATENMETIGEIKSHADLWEGYLSHNKVSETFGEDGFFDTEISYGLPSDGKVTKIFTERHFDEMLDHGKLPFHTPEEIAEIQQSGKHHPNKLYINGQPAGRSDMVKLKYRVVCNDIMLDEYFKNARSAEDLKLWKGLDRSIEKWNRQPTPEEPTDQKPVQEINSEQEAEKSVSSAYPRPNIYGRDPNVVPVYLRFESPFLQRLQRLGFFRVSGRQTKENIAYAKKIGAYPEEAEDKAESAENTETPSDQTDKPEVTPYLLQQALKADDELRSFSLIDDAALEQIYNQISYTP